MSLNFRVGDYIIATKDSPGNGIYNKAIYYVYETAGEFVVILKHPFWDKAANPNSLSKLNSVFARRFKLYKRL